VTKAGARWWDELRARAERLGRDLTSGLSGGVADSGHSAVYLRQLLRGNRAKRVLRSLRRRREGDREPVPATTPLPHAGDGERPARRIGAPPLPPCE